MAARGHPIDTNLPAGVEKGVAGRFDGVAGMWWGERARKNPPFDGRVIGAGFGVA